VKNRFQSSPFKFNLQRYNEANKPINILEEIVWYKVGTHNRPALKPYHCLRCVVLQVAFERQTLKPVFHLIGYRLWV
jgi:hypothetical protein